MIVITNMEEKDKMVSKISDEFKRFIKECVVLSSSHATISLD